MSDDQPCSGFPDQCPNIRPVAPALPNHGGGIRCGCTDRTLGVVISPDAMEGVTISANTAQAHTFTFPASNGQPLVTIRPDGTLEFGDDYQPEPAAQAFWEAVRRFAPTQMEQQFGKPLAARINAELAAGERAQRRVERLDQMATAWAERLPDTILTATAVEAIHQVTRED